MTEWTEQKIKIAILDLYEGHVNQGMRCIREIINTWAEHNQFNVSFDEFDVRIKEELPDTSYDIYISTGGPGSPLDTKGSSWDNKYFQWLQTIEDWNSNIANQPKHVFFICHSFQLICRHYGIGNVCKRKSTSFGVFPVHKLQEGEEEIIFEGLKDPFYVVDSRDFQVIEPNHTRLREIGAKILAIEKNRPHVPYERAIMAVRFNDYFIGTQFHPEADAIGMRLHLQTEERKEIVITNYGEEKWKSMVEQLGDPDKILWTYSCILPNFLNNAVGVLTEV
ncbi:MAG: GMP synthase [Chitinophagaceae bacterium]|nr:GMP synthase [Chitinophagaceae bacterium]MCW5905600.1 GMP synthase [Chitinophagaceae bacterium]